MEKGLFHKDVFFIYLRFCGTEKAAKRMPKHMPAETKFKPAINLSVLMSPVIF